MGSEVDPELQHLLPTFDPNSITVPKLRGILVQHDVDYPSSAKKSQLVDLFNANVKPKGPKLLRESAKVQRSTRGIEDVPSVRESIGDEDIKPTPAAKRGRTSSKKLAAVGVTAEEDLDNEPRPSTARKSRKSNVSPSARQAEIDDTPFSMDNPFQSGSSPIAETRSPSGERRRRTTSGGDSKERKRASSGRRKTDQVVYPNPSPRKSKSPPQSFEMSLSDMKRERERRAREDAVPAGEEFTPDEATALAKEESQNGPISRRTVGRKRSSKSGGVARVAVSMISLVILTAVALVWREEKLKVSFCGVGEPSSTFGGMQIYDWVEGLQPKCEPCPPNAICYQRLRASCDPDFILVPHPLALGGAVPLPPTCEPDGEKATKVKAVADRAMEELRERNAQFECGELKDDEGKRAVLVEIPEPTLKKTVASKRRKGMSNEEFEDLWESALGDIMSRTEIVIGSDGRTRTLRSTSLARISLACAVRRSVRLAVAENLWKLGAVIAALAAAAYARHRIRKVRGTEARAKQLASFVFDKLAAQAARHAQDSTRFPESWISMGQLRDDVLRDEFSAERRQRLWEGVQKKVEDNSNVRSMVREVRSGEVSRVWEWIGAVGQVEETSSGRKSDRYSIVGGSASPEGDGGEVSVHRGWDEGRPIY